MGVKPEVLVSKMFYILCMNCQENKEVPEDVRTYLRKLNSDKLCTLTKDCCAACTPSICMFI